MDNWTESDPVEPQKPIGYKKILNLYALFTAYTAYFMVDTVIIPEGAANIGISRWLYFLTLIISTIGIVGFANNIKIINKKLWFSYLYSFVFVGAYWQVECFREYGGLDYITKSYFEAFFNVILGYIAVIPILYFYAKSKIVWS